MPSRETFEILRGPVAILLVLIVIAILWSGAGPSEVDEPLEPLAFAVAAGPVDGRVLPQPTPSSTPIPTVAPTVTPTPAPTPTPALQLGPFAAEVLLCESLDGPECEDEIRRLERDTESFVALVRFTNVRAGDLIEAVLDGPSGTVRGGPYTLDWSGTGYYYATFAAHDLEPGEYTVTATRNGEAVAATELRTRRSRESDD